MRDVGQKRRKGFSLIELMIVLVILGILAGIGVPAYYAYVIRTNVANMVGAASGVKTAVAESRISSGNFDEILPADPDQTFENLGVDDPTLINPAISAVTFAVADENHMAIVLCGATIGEGADSAEDTVDIYLAATVYTGGIKWQCMYDGENSSYVPTTCRTEYDSGTYGVINGSCPRIAPVPPAV